MSAGGSPARDENNYVASHQRTDGQKQQAERCVAAKWLKPGEYHNQYVLTDRAHEMLARSRRAKA